MAQTIAKEIIYNLVEKVTNQRILQKRQIDLNQFLQICIRYLNAIDVHINRLQNIKNLKERISLVGKLMHDDQYSLRQMLILSHAFQHQWNNFLGRQIPITWISNAGVVYLASQQAVLNMYAEGTLSKYDMNKDQVYRGYIEGRAYNFNPFELNEQSQKIQDQLTFATQNKKGVFIEGKRRYNKTVAYTDKDIIEGGIPKRTLYWAVSEDGHYKHFDRSIASAGFLGQGYIQLALDYPTISMNPVNGPNYILSQEGYIELLAKYSSSGDAIPGIVRGDIKYDQSGNLQFAIKQGKAFHTASITGNIGIAQAFKENFSTLQNQKINIPQLRQHIQNFSNTNSEALYNYIIQYFQTILKNN